MLVIYCGEDSATARLAFTAHLKKYSTSDTEVISLAPSSVEELYKGLADNLSLFSTKKVFAIEGLEKLGFKKSTKAKKDVLYEALIAVSQDPHTILVDFEEGKQSRELKLKDLAKVYESKPSTSIFGLLDTCYPENKEVFISSLRTVCSTQDEMFTLIMLFRHVRLLVLVAQKSDLSKLPPWQKSKIIGQANKWDSQKLLDFYSGLIKIEINAKTSNNPYGIMKSLEILACYYL